MGRNGNEKSGTAGRILSAVILGAMLVFGTAFAAFADSDLPAPSSVSMEDDGTVSWDAPSGSGEYEVDKYEVEVYRERNGSFSDNAYKKKTVRDDTECRFSLSYVTRYYARVRAVYIGGKKSDWTESDIVNVSRDDIDNWDDDDDGPPANYNRPYNPGPGYINGQPINNGYNGSTLGSSSIGWIAGSDGKWWYRNYDGSYPVNCWMSVNGKWYYFDRNGYMMTGWVWYNNCWYLCLPDGQMATGWQNVNEKWYYLNESGVMLTGYQQIDGKTYYFDASGARVSGTTSPDGHTFDENGVMIS